jgi:hypothetical protein
MRGGRWIRAGAIGLLVVAVLHAVGHFSGGPADPAVAALEKSMRDYRFEIMGMHPSMHDIAQSLSLTMTVMLLFAGTIDLALFGAITTNPRAMRRLALINALGVAVLVGLFAYYRIPPPCVTLAVVGILFTIGLARTPKT